MANNEEYTDEYNDEYLCRDFFVGFNFWSRQRVDTIKREMFSQKSARRFVSIRHGRHVLSQCPKQRHFRPALVSIF